MARAPLSIAVVALGLALCPRAAEAQTAGEPPRDVAAPELEWRWPKFRTSEYWLTGAALGVAVGSAVAPVAPWKWSAAGAIDDGVRDALRLSAYQARQTAMDASDVLLAGSLMYPILGDAIVTAWGRRKSPEVARQMILIDVETLVITAAVTSATTALVSRERPFAANGACGTVLPEDHNDCKESFRYRYRSFFSGHTSLTFSSAALVCTHHARLSLYGGAGDTIACVSALGAAAATGTLRIVSDQHYASDVLVGATVGTLVGFGVPWLLHYRTAVGDAATGKALGSVAIVPTGPGVALVGLF